MQDKLIVSKIDGKIIIVLIVCLIEHIGFSLQVKPNGSRKRINDNCSIHQLGS